MLDDYSNLPALGAYGPINHLTPLISWLTGGIAGPTGRPLSLASFLLDANNWPASAYPFKVTNVLIELLNTTFVAWLSVLLLRALDKPERIAVMTGILSAGIWLLHPFFVSTTLYIVQRMAMLATSFILLGLILYLKSLRSYQQGRFKLAYLLFITGVGVCTLLATLSKENGFLLPLLVLILEATILHSPSSNLNLSESNRIWALLRILFLWIPIFILIAWFSIHLSGMLHADNKGRIFTAGQRLLTQTRAVSDYLWHLLVPFPYTAGLYHDNFPISRNLFTPWQTLPATLFILTLVVTGWRIRRRCPLLSAGILFYFASQLLTATIIPLEMYFEQRVYLSAVLLPLPLMSWIIETPRFKTMFKSCLIIVLIGSLAGLTDMRSTLWGQPHKMYMSWYAHNPESPRAVTTIALLQMHAHHPATAAVLLQPMTVKYPNNVMIRLNRLSALCSSGSLTTQEIENAEKTLRNTHQNGRVAYSLVQKFIGYFQNHRCPKLTTSKLRGLIEAGLHNPSTMSKSGWRQNYLGLLGQLELTEKHPKKAYQAFSKSLKAQARPGAAILESVWLASSGYPRLGLRLLDDYKTLTPWWPAPVSMAWIHAWWLYHHWYPHQFARVRHLMKQQIKQNNSLPRPNIVHLIHQKKSP